MAQRVLQGLPQLLSFGSDGNVPGPIGMINGVVQGMAEQHIGKLPEEYLATLLDHVLQEITYWRTGVRETTETLQESNGLDRSQQ